MSPNASLRDRRNDNRCRALRGSAPRAARGVTLVELLVVIALVVIVTAAAIPVMAPAIQNRRVREASRLVSSYLAAARSRAIETGRPVGVVVATSGFAPKTSLALTASPYSMNLSMAESQTPYAGDYTGSTAYVSSYLYNSVNNSYCLVVDGFGMNLNGSSNQAYDNFAVQQIQIGDRIRINNQGPYFYINASASQLDANGRYIVTVNQQNPLYLYPYNATGVSLGINSAPSYLPSSNLPGFSQNSGSSSVQGTPFPYQILRQPVRSSVDPLQLPEGIVIDMQWSGMSTGTSAVAKSNSGVYNSGVFTGLASPIISFGPNGSVDMLYDTGTQHASGPIYLLLGRNEQVNPPTNATAPPYPQNNLGDLNSMWICVNNQTGQVSTNPNYNPTFAANMGNVGTSSFSTTPSADIITARTLASGSTATVTVQGGN